jgi:hypothetical protein
LGNDKELGRFRLLLLLIFGFLFFALSPSSLKASASDPIYVGVLENIKDDYSNKTYSQVRVLFVNKSGEWLPAQDVPAKKITWAVVFRGKKIGTIESRALNSSVPSAIGAQKIVSQKGDIQIKEGADDFSYWNESFTTRPLLLVSEPRFNDPDHWEVSTPSDQEMKLAIHKFREIEKTYSTCGTDQDGKTITHEHPIPDELVKLFRAYRSNNGVLLIAVELDKELTHGTECNDIWPFWFVIGKDQKPKFLDTEIYPVDAADLDQKGGSDWIFQVSKYVDVGYVLFDDNFSKSVSFMWSEEGTR